MLTLLRRNKLIVQRTHYAIGIVYSVKWPRSPNGSLSWFMSHDQQKFEVRTFGFPRPCVTHTHADRTELYSWLIDLRHVDRHRLRSFLNHLCSFLNDVRSSREMGCAMAQNGRATVVAADMNQPTYLCLSSLEPLCVLIACMHRKEQRGHGVAECWLGWDPKCPEKMET